MSFSFNNKSRFASETTTKKTATVKNAANRSNYDLIPVPCQKPAPSQFLWETQLILSGKG